MIGRALQCVVERDLESELRRGSDERVEVLERTELRLDGRVSTRLVPDRPRASGIVRSGGERVVRSLARRDAHGMDRAGDRRRRSRATLCAEALRPCSGRCRDARDSVVCERGKELVPRSRMRARSRSTHTSSSRTYAGEIGRRVVVLEHACAAAGSSAAATRSSTGTCGVAYVQCGCAQRVARVAEARATRRGVDELRALEQLGGDVLPRANLLLELAAPRAESIRPRFHCVDPPPSPVDLETAHPLVGVLLVVHGHGAPLGIGGPAVADARREEIVTLLEDVGTNFEGITDHAFDGIAACVELWIVRIRSPRAPAGVASSPWSSVVGWSWRPFRGSGMRHSRHKSRARKDMRIPAASDGRRSFRKTQALGGHFTACGAHAMRGILIERYGGPEVLEYGELPDPAPGRGRGARFACAWPESTSPTSISAPARIPARSRSRRVSRAWEWSRSSAGRDRA